MPSFSGGTSFLRTSSTSIKNNLPPSNAGSGNKLKIPRFIIISAIIGSSEVRLCFAAEQIATVTPTGPETALIPYLPETRSTSERHITAQYETDVRTVCVIYKRGKGRSRELQSKNYGALARDPQRTNG